MVFVFVSNARFNMVDATHRVATVSGQVSLLGIVFQIFNKLFLYISKSSVPVWMPYKPSVYCAPLPVPRLISPDGVDTSRWPRGTGDLASECQSPQRPGPSASRSGWEVRGSRDGRSVFSRRIGLPPSSKGLFPV